MGTFFDYLERTKTKVNGTPDIMAPVRERIAGLIIDGSPLGERKTDVRLTKYERQRFADQQWAAVILVGCGVDRQVVSVTTLTERSTPTPDFQLHLRDERRPFFEVSQLSHPLEQQEVQTLSHIARHTQRMLEDRSHSLPLRGRFVLRFYDGVPPPQHTGPIVHELDTFIAEEARLHHASTFFPRVDVRFPWAHRYGCHVYHEDELGPLFIVVDPIGLSGNTTDIASRFTEIFEKKAAKVGAYLAGAPGEVWLGLHVVSTRLYPLGVVQQLAKKPLRLAPFSRVLVGCPTYGVTVEADGSRRIYSPMEDAYSQFPD